MDKITYRVRGTLHLESTGDDAWYDFEMDAIDGREPNEMEILRDMMESGEIQILHESTLEVTA